MGEIATLSKYLLPYSPDEVAAALGADQPVYPPQRCTEDRPVEIPLAADNVVDLAAIRARRQPLWTPERRQRQHMPTAEELRTPEGMIQSARETGLSLTGGLFGVTMGRIIATEMRKPGSYVDSHQPVEVAMKVVNGIMPKLGDLHEH